MRLVLAGLLLLAAPLAAQPADVVRVRLSNVAASATVTGSAIEVEATGRAMPSGETVRLRADGGRVRLDADGRSETSAQVTLRAEAPLRIRSGRLDRSYRGALVVTASGGRLQVINHVAMPDYVASVVASEYPFSEIEGIKAQAVLARTYATKRSAPGRAYDVEDHEGNQVYKGSDIETDRSRQAALETVGERLYYGADLAEAVYSSSSGGHTADNETIWEGTPLPYLRGVADPYDADAPDHRWTTTADASRLHAALSRRFGGSVRGVTVTERSFEGRARRVQLDGSRAISGTQFRAAVNAEFGYRTVRSTHFDLDLRGGQYVFTGQGFGHGVGMSQYGARAQAREGRTYREILDFYFQGTRVETDPSAAYPSVATSTPRWPTPRRDARTADAAADASPNSPTWTDTPTVRRRPTPRREARQAEQQAPPAPTRRGW